VRRPWGVRELTDVSVEIDREAREIRVVDAHGVDVSHPPLAPALLTTLASATRVI